MHGDSAPMPADDESEPKRMQALEKFSDARRVKASCHPAVRSTLQRAVASLSRCFGKEFVHVIHHHRQEFIHIAVR